jgi:HSP20 family molecular chaperone IbpA
MQITATTHDGLLEITVPVPEKSEPAPVTITPRAAD